MIKFIKKILGIHDNSSELFILQQEVELIKVEFNKKFDKIKSELVLKPEKPLNKEYLHNFEIRRVSKKLENFKSEFEFIEVSTRLYLMDDGYKKNKPPYVLEHHESGEKKLRCVRLSILYIPGYFNPSHFEVENTDTCDFKYFFNKSYQEIAENVRENSFFRKEEIHSISYHEI